MYVVRTISKYYSSRLSYLLQTWIKTVATDVYFITDNHLPHIDFNHFITTQKTCGNTSHSVQSLCCQTSHDFLLYRQHLNKYQWFCHFDDDQYVHIDNLYRYLSTLNHQKAYYIGRNSWNMTFKRKKSPHPGHFWFATLGAGVCFSRRTIDLLESYTKTVSQFVNGCLKEFYPDDIYLGFILNNYLNISLTKNIEFHSHLERSLFNDKRDLIDNFYRQITFGFPLLGRFF
ncbi:unnamed protein product [Adineta ricciae]|uniref:Fringe-like glycosyltransferase domain-containing protein n=1 Tax=Adineta ricciae TaxID=249248 RepID=A0A816DE93_ADIRI|nr:unnamed protein product [Adineta ricciae]